MNFILTKNGYSAANKFIFEHLKVFGTKMSPGTKLTVKNKNSVVKDAKCSIDKNGVSKIFNMLFPTYIYILVDCISNFKAKITSRPLEYRF